MYDIHSLLDRERGLVVIVIMADPSLVVFSLARQWPGWLRQTGQSQTVMKDLTKHQY